MVRANDPVFNATFKYAVSVAFKTYSASCVKSSLSLSLPLYPPLSFPLPPSLSLSAEKCGVHYQVQLHHFHPKEPL